MWTISSDFTLNTQKIQGGKRFFVHVYQWNIEVALGGRRRGEVAPTGSLCAENGGGGGN